MRKVIGFTLSLCLTISLLMPYTTHAAEKKDEIVNSAKSAILMEKNSGMTLYEKNADEKLPPASMTKIMTLLIIMEELENNHLKLNEKVRVSEHAASMGGSQIFLEAGEEMKVNDLIKGIAVASGNDASVAMAERIGGTEQAFVKRMNDEAKELGLENTHFENPTGLPAKGHYSTAHDMAVMARELLLHDTITKYTSIYEDYLRKGQKNEFWLVNTNKMIKTYPGMDGLKTGFTSEAKYCLTASAKRDSMHMVAVVMGADSPKKRNADIASMLDYGFGQYEGIKLFSKNTVVKKKTITRGKPKIMNISPEKDVVILKKKSQPKDSYETTIKLANKSNLPVQKGDQVGWMIVKKKEAEVAKVKLVAGEQIDRAGFLTLWQRSWRNLTSFQRF
ncbi:D-alanyl-D-alanine carboxypeptidase [Halobacillus salinarum]|uniref:serine-type D-Ala-D-Ala carboxypeptidase n=1 Tax=Halobacillus salinarum TaxID=2932257 RepID=A0ABY4EGS8_9BACI|nr:D-alanyl-D-alanine carboxypeptidase family protein [Halobacillus salinarum]UOQ42647.1 D-alanyl-D-alanine carboxypeptidase [Halobacillus salinarum]